MHFDDALPQRANPVLRIAVQQHIPNVEPCLNPRTLKFLDVRGHLQRAEQELVPDFFNGDHNSQLFGEGQQLANFLLRTAPGVAIRGLRINDRRHEEHGVRSPQLGVVQRRAHSRQALFHDRGITGRERILPVVHVHHRIDAHAGTVRGFLDFLGLVLVWRRQRLDRFEAYIACHFQAVRIAQLRRQHVEEHALLDWQGCRRRRRGDEVRPG